MVATLFTLGHPTIDTLVFWQCGSGGVFVSGRLAVEAGDSLPFSSLDGAENSFLFSSRVHSDRDTARRLAYNPAPPDEGCKRVIFRPAPIPARNRRAPLPVGFSMRR